MHGMKEIIDAASRETVRGYALATYALRLTQMVRMSNDADYQQLCRRFAPNVICKLDDYCQN